jgi:hypothetical protein
MSTTETKLGKESLAIVKDYSEYSTVQGIIYIFQSKQTTLGKVFWTSGRQYHHAKRL